MNSVNRLSAYFICVPLAGAYVASLLVGCSKGNPEDVAATPGIPQAAASAASALPAPQAVPSPGLAPIPRDVSQLCHKICAASLALRCKRSDACEPNCRYMASSEKCQRELFTFYDCLTTQPVEHWECLEDGTGAIREGFCDKGQSDFAACLQGSG